MPHSTDMPHPDPDPIMAIAEATKLLGYKNTSSVARLVYERKLVPARKLPGKNGAYLFHRADVEALARARGIELPADQAPAA